MRAPRIAAGLPIVFGLGALGGLGAGVWLGAPEPNAQASPATPLASTAASSADDGRALRAEVEALREALAQREAGAARAPLDARAGPARATEASVGAAIAASADELTRLLDSGALHAAFAADPDGLNEFLFRIWMQGGHPEEALRILRAHPLQAESCAELATALLARGDRAGAAEALVLGVARHAEDFDWRDQRWGPQLERLDPAGALAALDQWKEQHGGKPDARMDTRRAALLARLGRGAEASALLDWVWQNSEPNELAWTTLGRVDPALAEQRMLRSLAGDGAADWENQQRYLSFLRDQRRPAELTQAIQAWLERPAADLDSSAELLLELDPASFSSALEQRLARAAEPAETPDLWIRLAAAQERLGKQDAAFASCANAIAVDPFHEQAARWMIERDPQRYFALAEPAVQRSNDDESWGDLGDAYMLAGRHGDAARAWRQAQALDPEDGEWTERERALAAGIDPFSGEPLAK